MRLARLVLPLFTLTFLVACGAPPKPQFTWREPVGAVTALPEKVALFVDASYLRRAPDFRPYIVIDESIDLARVINDQAEAALTGNKYSLALQNKYFIAAYRQREETVADRQGETLYTRPSPLHMDPDVCRTEKPVMGFKQLWLLTRQILIGETKQIPARLANEMGARYQADTLALVIGISRKNDDIVATPPPAEPAQALDNLAASVIAVLLIRTLDGAVVYQAITPIAGPQRESTIRAAVDAAFDGLPRREHQPTYPVPTVSLIDDTKEPAETMGSPWIGNPNSALADENLERTQGRPGTIVGQKVVNLLRRPGALADTIGAVEQGARVRVLKMDMNWYLIMLPDGRSGWVYSKWVELY